MPRKHRDIFLIKGCILYRNIMSSERAEDYDYMAEDEDMAEFVDDMNEDNNERGGAEMGDDEYNVVCVCFSYALSSIIVICLHQNVILL